MICVWQGLREVDQMKGRQLFNFQYNSKSKLSVINGRKVSTLPALYESYITR